MFKINHNVSETDVENLYRHVHHASSVKFLELARLAYLESVGFPNESLLKQGLFLVITRIEVNYKREIFAGPISVTCENPRIEGKSLVLDQRILNEKGKEAIIATVYSVFMSGETRRAIEAPTEFRLAFENSPASEAPSE